LYRDITAAPQIYPMAFHPASGGWNRLQRS
jgi:hypothetical protein